MRDKSAVRLSTTQREYLRQMLSAGIEKTRKLTRARVVLKADESWTDEAIHRALDVSISTVARIRRRFVEEGLQGALNRRPTRREYKRKLDGNAEAHLIALACGAAPEGRERWSLRLLSDRLVTLEQVEVDSVSYETVRRVLKKTNLSPGKSSNG